MLFDEAEIARRVGALAPEISRAIADHFTIVALLKGAFVFVADLVRALDGAGRHPRVEFITLSSYGSGRVSAGAVRLIGELPEGVAGRAVLLVDDVADTGRSLAFARDLLLGQGAARVWICALIDKPGRRKVDRRRFHRLHRRRPLRGRLRYRLRRAIPPPALHRRPRLNPSPSVPRSAPGAPRP